MLTVPPDSYMLDTCFIINYVFRPQFFNIVESRYALQEASLMACCVVMGELSVVHNNLSHGDKKRKAMQSFLKKVTILRIDKQEIYKCYYNLDIFSRVRSPENGNISKKMGKNDLWIAALAQETDSTVLTCDGDFNHLAPCRIKCINIHPSTLQIEDLR